MSRHVWQEKLNGQERKEVIEEVQKRMREAALAAIKLVLEALTSSRGDRQAGTGEGRTAAGEQEVPRGELGMWPLWMSRCEPVQSRWALPASVRHQLGTDQRTEGADAGVRVLRP